MSQSIWKPYVTLFDHTGNFQPNAIHVLAIYPPPTKGGTADEDRFYNIAEGNDGSVVITGHTFGVWSIRNSGDADFAAIKLNEHGVELWRWQVTHLVLSVCMRHHPRGMSRAF